MVVLMPCAGSYKRYPPNGMPKYIRPLNDMRPMFQWALDGVRGLTDKKILFAVRKENEEEWGVSDIIKERENAEVMILDYETNGPADTVYQMLNHFDVKEPFLVHDCDCTWKPNSPWPNNKNCVAVAYRETAIGDRSSKSWVETITGSITGIEEKGRPTDWYCCGGYQFDNPTVFKNSFEARLRQHKEVFCSHIIQEIISDGTTFCWASCSGLNDWGTFEKYVAWRKQKKVYFFDLDGTITDAGAPYGKTTWKDVGVLFGVRDKIDELKKQNGYIIIVSSRPESVRELTEKMLIKNEIQYDKLIFGIPNGTRVMINDYAQSNPYPVVEAINTRRNTADWISMI